MSESSRSRGNDIVNFGSAMETLKIYIPTVLEQLQIFSDANPSIALMWVRDIV